MNFCLIVNYCVFVMENLKKLLSFLAPFPAWLRVVIAALVTAIVSVCVLMTACSIASSCGITQSVVNNFQSDDNTIEMGVTPSTTTSTTATTEIPINAPLNNSMWVFFLLLHFVNSNDKSKCHDDMCRIVVEADDEVSAHTLVSNHLYASRFTSPEYLESFDVLNIISLPPLFYWD